jgi:hypothetical protein
VPNLHARGNARPMADINTGRAVVETVASAMQRGVVPHRLDDETTHPKMVDDEQVSRNRGVDLSARLPVRSREFDVKQRSPGGPGSASD